MSLEVKRVVVTSEDGKDVWVTPNQAEALSSLVEIQGGGCGGLHGYIPSTGYITSPVVDIQMLTNFSYEKLVERKRAALEQISFTDVQDDIANEPKLASLSVEKQNEIFEARKQMLLDSLDTTLSGDRSDAHRQGHDRCYARFSGGIKGHLKTEKGKDGLKHPVLLNGLPVLESIMIQYLELNRKVIKEGVRKTVNSGAPVLMGNAISKQLNSRSTSYKTASLKEGNFDKLVVSKQEYLSEDVSPNVLDLLTAYIYSA
jgi:hypothetical protein